MDSITVVLIAAFGVAAIIQTLSASYFEVAYALTNRMFPDGNLAIGSIEIPDQRVVTFFHPKWLYRGGHAGKWLQYLIAIPVVAYFGWLSAVIYLAVLMGAKLVMALVSPGLLSPYLSRSCRCTWSAGSGSNNSAGIRVPTMRVKNCSRRYIGALSR